MQKASASKVFSVLAMNENVYMNGRAPHVVCDWSSEAIRQSTVGTFFSLRFKEIDIKFAGEAETRWCWRLRLGLAS